MAWIALFFAGLLEIVWAFAMKQSHGFTRLVPSLITLGAMIASFGLLSMAMRSLPLGTAYMIWTGSARWVPLPSASPSWAKRSARRGWRRRR